MLAPYGLFIKSWRGARKYAIKTSSLNDNIDTSYKLNVTIKVPPLNSSCVLLADNLEGTPKISQKLFSADSNAVNDKFGE